MSIFVGVSYFSHLFVQKSASNSCPIDGHSLHIKSSDVIPDLPISASTEVPFVVTGPVPSRLIYPPVAYTNDGEPVNNNTTYDVIYGCLAPPGTGTGAVLVATLSYESRTVEVHLQSNSASPNQPVKLRVRIRRDGVSLMPSSMNDFKCTYKLFW